MCVIPLQTKTLIFNQTCLVFNILEACRHPYDNDAKGVEHLDCASSSSVYGTNKKIPYSTDDKVENPIFLYAATKKNNELMTHAYNKLYNIPSTGLRFFTVYGPAGWPDMEYFGFTNKLREGKTISGLLDEYKINQNGRCKYIEPFEIRYRCG